MVPGVRPVNVTQYFVSVLEADWLAVITATTGTPGLAEGVEIVADGMAGSLGFRPAPPDYDDQLPLFRKAAILGSSGK